ncbi:MAG: response regulator [Acidobacteriaceae bacterium]|nr:response regulator [Acidobacteriaceae bacterium]
MLSTLFNWRNYPLRVKTGFVVLAPVTALLLSCGFIAWLSAQQRDAHNWVAHSLEVRLALRRLEHDRSRQTLQYIQTLVSDNPRQESRASHLRSLLNQSDQTDSLNQQIRDQIEAMDDEEVRLLSMRTNRFEHLQAASTTVIAISMFLGVLGGLLSTSLLSHNICHRVSQLLESFNLVANGMQVTSLDKSTDELGRLASGLAQTSRVLSERAGEITELNWKLETVLRAVTEVSIIAEDLPGRITIFNAGATKLLGYRPEEVIGRETLAVLQGKSGSCPESDTAADLKSARQRALQNASREFETQYARNDGLCLNVQVSVAPLKDVTGRVVGFLHVAQDVTPRKLLEAELRKKLGDLRARDESPTESKDTERLSEALEALSNPYEEEEQNPRRKSPTILIVDDFEPTRFLLKAYLQNQGFVLHFASNGEEAIEKVTTRPYDLILLDIEMPKMDGYETASRIRAWEQEHGRLRVPIVALSAHDAPEATSIASVWTSYLRKPLSKSQLLAEVNMHLSAHARA